MYHDLPRTARFWWFLFAIDQDLANAIRKNGCSCGGRLHSADYLRNPRGIRGQLPECLRIRLSFCCDRDGCRKRVTPPSVRFLGRKVYLGVIVILISAMRQGPSPRRVRELSARFGVDRQTIARWQVFWREHFPQSHFWKIEGAGPSPSYLLGTIHITDPRVAALPDEVQDVLGKANSLTIEIAGMRNMSGMMSAAAVRLPVCSARWGCKRVGQGRSFPDRE